MIASRTRQLFANLFDAGDALHVKELVGHRLNKCGFHAEVREGKIHQFYSRCELLFVNYERRLTFMIPRKFIARERVKVRANLRELRLLLVVFALPDYQIVRHENRRLLHTYAHARPLG